MTILVLTVVGTDRPGLVSALSTLVDEHGGSWLTSRMAHLAGQFAGIVEVQVPAERAVALGEALDALGDSGLTVVATHGDEQAAPTQAYRLHLLGHDQPGIVAQVSEELSSAGVSIEELETHTVEAPMAGGMLFEAHATLRVPEHLPSDVLRGSLEAIARELMVDLDLTEA